MNMVYILICFLVSEKAKEQKLVKSYMPKQSKKSDFRAVASLRKLGGTTER